MAHVVGDYAVDNGLNAIPFSQAADFLLTPVGSYDIAPPA